MFKIDEQIVRQRLPKSFFGRRCRLLLAIGCQPLKANGLFQKWVVTVFLGENDVGGGNAPIDADCRVVPSNGTLRFGVVEVVALILKESFGAQNHKAVGHSARQEELSVVLLREFAADVSAECGAVFADIDCVVDHTSAHAPNEFALSVRRQLIVQAAQHAVRRFTLVVLHEGDVQPRLTGELLGVVTLEKVSALVAKYFWLDDENSLYFGFDYVHWFALLIKDFKVVKDYAAINFEF